MQYGSEPVSLSVVQEVKLHLCIKLGFFLRYLLPSEVVFSQTWRWNSCSFDDCYRSDIAFCIVIFPLREFGLLWSHCWVVWEITLAVGVELDSQAWTLCSKWNMPAARWTSREVGLADLQRSRPTILLFCFPRCFYEHPILPHMEAITSTLLPVSTKLKFKWV